MRRSGRTTRLVDEAIQILFTKGKVTFIDHYYGECEKDHRRANEFGFKILLRRLDMEHGGLDNFEINRRQRDFTIKLKSNEKAPHRQS